MSPRRRDKSGDEEQDDGDEEDGDEEGSNGGAFEKKSFTAFKYDTS